MQRSYEHLYTNRISKHLHTLGQEQTHGHKYTHTTTHTHTHTHTHTQKRVHAEAKERKERLKLCNGLTDEPIAVSGVLNYQLLEHAGPVQHQIRHLHCERTNLISIDIFGSSSKSAKSCMRIIENFPVVLGLGYVDTLGWGKGEAREKRKLGNDWESSQLKPAVLYQEYI
ncbi:unnamed protein product [Enterobius vermicularis]|uniref:Smr domain-containing protein n=1 Tax=Enterobius vermicularis TaxID=51028 RepID=A0A0N4VQ26_ENTVE|nr:unnamed protein product [Enterobius vermicularis]